MRNLRLEIRGEGKMKNLKKLIATFSFAALLFATTTTANAGILISDLTKDSQNQPCTEQKEDKTNWGIIISDFTGIIVYGFTGIIIVGVAETPADCGIIVYG